MNQRTVVVKIDNAKTYHEVYCTVLERSIWVTDTTVDKVSHLQPCHFCKGFTPFEYTCDSCYGQITRTEMGRDEHRLTCHNCRTSFVQKEKPGVRNNRTAV